ncbi:MAG: sodium-dependent transporter [Desulfovibrio sp.]|nr:sodium-dependent transporter [Desulfovibrio sp.]
MSYAKSTNFSGQIGFVLASAGSAVGLGNIWRFPYLAAKDGLLFIVLYLVLVLTFGFALLITDITIGRKTRRSSIFAYYAMSPKWRYLGVLTFLVPVLIMTYYPVIGGWITRYIAVYATGLQSAAADSAFFTSFISSTTSPILYGILFLALTGLVIFFGVQSGIERVSKWLLPLLFLMLIGIACYALTIEHTDANGQTRTGLMGLAYMFTPKGGELTLSTFLQVLLDAVGQMFFSLSISMGIMISYGSYVNKEVNLTKCVLQIEIFDTVAAMLAAIIIIPTIYVFSGPEGMSAGPSLMFISLPKIFDVMGTAGVITGIVFFVMAAFAALTSCISVLEPIVANIMDMFETKRKITTIVTTLVYMAAATVITLGYSSLYMEVKLPNGSTGQLLDIADYAATAFMMPFISLFTCILIGWIVGSKWIIGEIEREGNVFSMKGAYTFLIRYLAPVLMFILFLQSTGFLDYILKK